MSHFILSLVLVFTTRQPNLTFRSSLQPTNPINYHSRSPAHTLTFASWPFVSFYDYPVISLDLILWQTQTFLRAHTDTSVHHPAIFRTSSIYFLRLYNSNTKWSTYVIFSLSFYNRAIHGWHQAMWNVGGLPGHVYSISRVQPTSLCHAHKILEEPRHFDVQRVSLWLGCWRNAQVLLCTWPLEIGVIVSICT